MQKINSITCPKCGKSFDVNTENIEWEHMGDKGETESDSSLHDYGLFQKIVCPHCGEEITIVVHAIGESIDRLRSIKVSEIG